MSLVTVEKLTDMGLAQLARMKLESEGVPVHLHSIEHAGLLGMSVGPGGIRVQVPEGFAARARDLLEELFEDINAPDSDDEATSEEE